MAVVKLFLFVLLFISLNVLFANAFKWKDCGRKDATVFLENIDVNPKPMAVQSKYPMYVSIGITTKQVMDNNVTVSLKLSRHIYVLWNKIEIPVPCVGKFGSCEHNFCDFVQKMKDVFCPVLQSLGKECSCPIEPDNFTVNNIPVKVTHKIPPIIAAIGSGTYGIRGTLRDGSGKELGCWDVEADVKMN
ncbi:ganglioside GM2 activator-like protein [Leptotrombidium deliense]|uniref:Ganglioside GM2 activator-like protein n=1 Tax=Leptotrombidium deliense TaxID=299467 RepID=A0A443S1X0_9ACAR|nr:ganglioside GM2 activator-like protein [Leptotrombidium deliense]